MLLRTVSILWLALSVPSLAEPKAYEPVAVSYDQGAAGDAALRALVQKLHAAVAERQLPAVDAVLSPAFAVIECDADPTKPCTPATKGAVRSNPKMPPPARIRWALCCKDIAPAKITKTLRDETVLGLIGAALEEDTIGAHPLLPGAACLPAWPLFDAAKAAKLAAQADVERDNLRVTSAEIVLRTKPEAGAAEAARLAKGQMAALVTDLADSLPDGWTALALPQGGLGYTDQLGLNEIAPGGLCFQKDEKNEWKIMLSILRRS